MGTCQSYQKVLVMGLSQTGKSTLLKQLEQLGKNDTVTIAPIKAIPRIGKIRVTNIFQRSSRTGDIFSHAFCRSFKAGFNCGSHIV